jgi:hypothetical protein
MPDVEEAPGARTELPSGRRVALYTRADPSRPWHVRAVTGGFVVVREWRGDSSRTEVYREPGARDPLVLEERDAKALIAVLAARYRKRTSARRS